VADAWVARGGCTPVAFVAALGRVHALPHPVRLVFGNALIQILQAKPQLFVGQLLRTAAKLATRQAKQQKANFLVLRMQFNMLFEQATQHVLQYGGVVRQVFRINLHRPMMINAAASAPDFIAAPAKIIRPVPACGAARGRATRNRPAGPQAAPMTGPFCRSCWQKARQTAPAPDALSARTGQPHHARSDLGVISLAMGIATPDGVRFGLDTRILRYITGLRHARQS
jgi:hypothetical protein